MKKYILVIVLVIFSQLVFADIVIKLISNEPIDFCGEKVSFGSRVDISGSDITVLKISITNYKEGEDSLAFEPNAKISGKWDESLGSLILSGVASAEDYKIAVQNVEYSNRAASPTNGTRSIAITLDDTDYLPATGHFYKYFSSNGISWSTAKAKAESKDLYGLKGYLATITSVEENDFIWSKVKGVGWIGASDAEDEGKWKWVTGPEKGTLFWEGDYTNGRPVNNHYEFWSTGEPNNVGNGEYYAHINQNPDKEPKSWNDLPDIGGTGHYYPQGYIVEFGGMGEPDVSLFAELKINVWNILFSGDTEKTICQNDTIRLNQKSPSPYEWGPITHMDDPTRADPQVWPIKRTVYTVTSTVCPNLSESFTVNVKPRPSSDFSIDDGKCSGYNAKVKYTGTGSGQAEYNWYYFDSLYASGIGLQELEVALGFKQDNRTVGLIVDEDGCLSELKEKHIKVIPDLQIEVDIEEGCEPLIVEFIAITKGSVSDDNFTWDFGDGVSGKGKTTGHIYQNDGFYDVGLRIVSNEDCENYGLVEDMVKVYALPTVAFSPEPEERSIVNPEFSFQNNSENALTYTWDFGDTIGYSSDFEPTHRYKKMGWFDVKLLAESEFGCKDSAYQKVLVAFDQIFPPNAFSPNSADLVNQTFLPVNEEVLEAGYYLQVFNRWGERIFEAKDEFIGWDGKMKNGQFAPSGVYTWVVAYQDFIGRNHRQNGAVTLVF